MTKDIPVVGGGYHTRKPEDTPIFTNLQPTETINSVYTDPADQRHTKQALAARGGLIFGNP